MKPLAETYAATIRELAPNHTAKQIAAEIGLLGESAVRKWCRRHGVAFKPEFRGYPPEFDQAIRDGAARKLSLRQVARQLAVSPGKISGRAHRLGVQFTSKQPTDVRAANGRKAAAVQKIARNPAAMKGAIYSGDPRTSPLQKRLNVVYANLVARSAYADSSADDTPGLCTIHTLTATSCRYPIGEPSADSTYCGQRALDGKPYCSAHHSACYAGLPPKKRRAA